jgi:hypothetical protein
VAIVQLESADRLATRQSEIVNPAIIPRLVELGEPCRNIRLTVKILKRAFDIDVVGRSGLHARPLSFNMRRCLGETSRQSSDAAATVTCQPVFRGKLRCFIPASPTEGVDHVWDRSCN